MEYQSFQTMLTDLSATFQRKPVELKTKDRLWGKVQHIPDEAVPWITERLEEGESYPRNLFLAIRDMWSKWREAHPEKRAQETRHCPLGCTNGVFLAWGWDERFQCYVQYAFDCRHCRPTSEHKASPHWLESSGFKIQPHDKTYSQMQTELNGLEVERGTLENRFGAVVREIQEARRSPARGWDYDVSRRTRPVECAAGEQVEF